MAYESLLLCKKCNTNLVIPKRLVVKKLTVYVWARCAHCKKQMKFTLPLPQVHEWVDAMAENFFRCPKCGVSGVVTRTIPSGEITKLKLYCSSCQKAFVKIATSSVYGYLMASHINQMKMKAVQRSYAQMPPMAYIASKSPAASAQPAQAPAAPEPLTPPEAPSPPVTPAPPAPVVPPRTCSNCHEPLTPDAKFCRKCGVPVEAEVVGAPRCPFCGATLSEKAKICPKCSSEVRCEKCDALLSPNARFCVKCGEAIKKEVEEVEAPTLTCHFCGGAIELDQKVCPECGKPTVCPNCGNHLKSSVRFCNKCGTNVSEITMETPEPVEAEEFEEELEEEEEAPGVMVKCQTCGASMSEIYTFCTICGSKLEK